MYVFCTSDLSQSVANKQELSHGKRAVESFVDGKKVFARF